MRILKAIRKLTAALLRRERARLAGLTAKTPDELVEAATLFGLETRIARRWWSILGGHVATFFRLPIVLPSDLVELSAAPCAAAPAPVGLRIVR